jgi:hypothetical protein
MAPGTRVRTVRPTPAADKNYVRRSLPTYQPLTVCPPPAGRAASAGRVWCRSPGPTGLYLLVPASHLEVV